MNKQLRRFFADAKAMSNRLAMMEIELIGIKQVQQENKLKLYNLFRPMVVDSLPMIAEKKAGTDENI